MRFNSSGIAVAIIFIAVLHFSVAVGGAPATDQSDWKLIAKKLVEYLLTRVLGPNYAPVFMGPVDSSIFGDYPDYVDTPMWFDLINKRLEINYYDGPEGFYNDVLLLADNCYKYNAIAHPSEFGHVGVRLENAFLTAWGKTPLSAVVPPRPLRPMPPPIPKSKPPKKTSAHRVARPRGGGGGRGRPGRPPGVARTKSVNSYGALANQPIMTQAMQNALVNALNTPAILEANLQEVINILNAANEMGVDEDGEASLDLEKITPPTARKLYDLVVGRTSAGGQRLEDDDDDYDPEEEDE